ncbi:MAG TPA: tyrosine-type recombinase/integrase [Actinomycetota bacterium]|jgi:integrase|nr:tyrosine-type recombinase/integrase [Actinomycetota bacterium]
MHALLGYLLVVGPLEQHPNLGIRKPEQSVDGLVFPSGRGTYLQRSNFSRLVWRPAVQQLGLDGLRFHDLRHTAATLAAAAGATTRELMERMGHTSPAIACATSTSWPTARAPSPPPWTAWPAMPGRKTGAV